MVDQIEKKIAIVIGFLGFISTVALISTIEPQSIEENSRIMKAESKTAEIVENNNYAPFNFYSEFRQKEYFGT